MSKVWAVIKRAFGFGKEEDDLNGSFGIEVPEFTRKQIEKHKKRKGLIADIPCRKIPKGGYKYNVIPESLVKLPKLSKSEAKKLKKNFGKLTNKKPYEPMIMRDIPRNDGKLWSERADKSLRKLFKKNSNQFLSRRLGRSVPSVKRRLFNLGLRR